MIANINWLFTKTATELGNVRDSNVVQSPKSVFVKSRETLFQPYFNTIGQSLSGIMLFFDRAFSA